jgi:hypothetical protein
MSWVASQFGPGERLASRDIDLSAFTFRDPKINMTDALEEDVHLWLGKKGVVACTHYDAKHNLYLQVFGRKRFEIAPPDMVRDCKPFPKFHPHARQCRESPRSMLVVDLNPGDLLYLPPFWLHRVESLDTSASLSYWSDCEENFVYDRLLGLGLPFESSWVSVKLFGGFREFADLLFGKGLLSRILRDRYSGSCAGYSSVELEYELSSSERALLRSRASEYAALFSLLDVGVSDIRKADLLDEMLIVLFGEDASYSSLRGLVCSSSSSSSNSHSLTET